MKGYNSCFYKNALDVVRGVNCGEKNEDRSSQELWEYLGGVLASARVIR